MKQMLQITFQREMKYRKHGFAVQSRRKQALLKLALLKNVTKEKP